MGVFFTEARLADLCNSRRAMEKRWGATGAELIGRRLSELDALEMLDDLERLPGTAIHKRGERHVADFGGEVLVTFRARTAAEISTAREPQLVILVEEVRTTAGKGTARR